MNLMVKTRRTPWQILESSKGIEVEKRSASGSILTLRLSYEHGMVKVFSEYNIRKVTRTWRGKHCVSGWK